MKQITFNSESCSCNDSDSRFPYINGLPPVVVHNHQRVPSVINVGCGIKNLGTMAWYSIKILMNNLVVVVGVVVGLVVVAVVVVVVVVVVVAVPAGCYQEGNACGEQWQVKEASVDKVEYVRYHIQCWEKTNDDDENDDHDNDDDDNDDDDDDT